MRTITRGGHRFQVVDHRYNGWDFWGAFAGGSWEAAELAEIAKLPPGSLLFDLGAWVGPISLWAAAHGVRSVAVEPDSKAVESLRTNVEASGFSDLVTVEPYAIMHVPGMFTLNIQNGGGDSQSSMARSNMFDSVQVEATTLDLLIAKHGRPDLVKIDIEGAEGMAVPAFGPLLRSLGVPMLLALHYGWIPDTEALEAELDEWSYRHVENETGYYTPTV